jgi:3-dehydroquinate synthase
MDGLIHTIGASAGTSSYDILVGNSFLHDAFGRREVTSAERIAFIISARIEGLYGEYVRTALGDIRGKSFFFTMDDREENKSYIYAERFLEKFIAEKINRKGVVIGIGGGVVGDFAGFCAGAYMRGIPVIHVPTTLLAMVDSSIGGKVAVNLTVGKNIVGLFHQPALVVSDLHFLESLSEQEFKNGIVESLKHGLIGDDATLELLEENDLRSIRGVEAISALVSRSVRFKTSIVERDEREAGLRSILNFGHTLGHAIESSKGYRGVSHGQAVAAGMQIKIEASRRMGLLTDYEANRVNALLKRYGLVPGGLDLDVEMVMRHMEFDKKNFGGEVNFVLLKGIGKPFINQRIPVDLLKRVMAEIC